MNARYATDTLNTGQNAVGLFSGVAKRWKKPSPLIFPWQDISTRLNCTECGNLPPDLIRLF